MTMLLFLLLLFLRLFFGWRPCFLGFSAVAGVPAIVADPDLGSGAFLTPGSGIRDG